jgi:translation initiation factor 1
MQKNNRKERIGVTYSTNPEYQYQFQDVTEEETLPKEKQVLRIALDKRNRSGKTVTLIIGFRGTNDDLAALEKIIKVKCGVGGSSKAGEIIIQGDLRQKIMDILTKEGYIKSKII